jgi:hypothetical protein
LKPEKFKKGARFSVPLIDVAALTGDLRPGDTLIFDEDGIYDPSTFNGRLLLGLKATMRAELHVIKVRIRDGIFKR